MNFTSDSNDVSPKLLLGVLLAAVFESYTHFRESEEEFVKRVSGFLRVTRKSQRQQGGNFLRLSGADIRWRCDVRLSNLFPCLPMLKGKALYLQF